MNATIHREIKGQPYTFIKNEQGYGVCCASSPTDRLHRSYQVYCDENGVPTRCTCPDCHYKLKTCGLSRSNWCKHMREAEAIRTAQTTPQTRETPCQNGSFILHHPTKNRHYTFKINGDSAVIEKWDACWQEERVETTRIEARKKWAWLIKIGYQQW